MPNPPSSYEYGAFAVLPARTVIGTNPLYFVFGISKALIEEFCEQNPGYEEADSFAVVSRILTLKQNEITLLFGGLTPGFEIRRMIIDRFTYPDTLPQPTFTISIGRILIWDNQNLGANLRE